MKKCFVLILSLMLILPLILSVNAKDGDTALTKREAQELVAEAFNYNYQVRCDTSNYCKNGVFLKLRHEDLSNENLAGHINLEKETWYSEVNEDKLLGGSYDAMKEYGAVYFGAIGGAGALLAKCIKSAKLIAYEDLGAEALRKLYVEDMPLMVIIDSEGNNLYELGREEYLASKK